ncbi:MAG: 1-hydroxycarotenoid 3,4-desaturase CrtD [Cytophagaceae bacterium]
MKKKIAIIGSGIGGIAAAIRLSRDHQVSVFEASSSPGGKLSEIRNQGFRFDAGPSLFTMPALVEDLFALHGKDVSDYFRYQKLEVICKYFYEDGTRLHAWADREKFCKELSEAFQEDSDKVKGYLKNCETIYELTSDLFLFNSLSLKSFSGKKAFRALKNASRLHLFSTLDQVNRKYFKDPRLVQLFNRYATYNGSDPYATPGIMSVIPHLEYNMGAFIPKGGMYDIIISLVSLAEECGVRFHYNSKVDRIETIDGSARAILVNGERKLFDTIVSNADIHATYRKLLPQEKQPEKTLSQPKSSSAMVFYWNIRTEFPELGLHNIFFSEDYKHEFDCIFRQKAVSDDPTVYINISSKFCPADAPEGCENWFVMINVPHDSGQDWAQIREKSRTNIIAKLSRMLCKDVSQYISGEEVLDPLLIESRTSSFGGALYGNSSNNRYAAFLRHANYSSSIKNLYFCGGSVHPGGGIPLCLLSAKIVSERILNDQSKAK